MDKQKEKKNFLNYSGPINLRENGVKDFANEKSYESLKTKNYLNQTTNMLNLNNSKKPGLKLDLDALLQEEES